MTVPLTMLIVSFLVFTCISFSSGDSSAYILSEDAAAEDVAAYREAAGLTRPFGERYLDFLIAFATLDWGMSAGGADITGIIAARLPVTLMISFLALLMSLMIAVPVSYFTLREGTVRSALATAWSAAVSASPVFLTAIFLVLSLAAYLGLFPVAGYVPISAGIGPWFGSLFLPSLSLAFLHSSLFILMFRRALRENMRKPYAVAAEARGMSYMRIAACSATKPALPLLITLAGESAAAFLGGSAAVETVFALPGLGSLLVSAALGRDARLAGILILLVALFVSVSSLAAETVSHFLDPRNRRSG